MITEVRLLYAPFKRFVSGHVCLIFKFTDGKEVVISPEARTDNFIPLLGFLPFYQLKYSKLAYNDYIKKYERTSRIFHSTRLEIEPELAMSLYSEMTGRMSQLEHRTELYHILLNSCITNTLRHLKRSAKFELSPLQIVQLHFNPHKLGNISPRTQSTSTRRVE